MKKNFLKAIQTLLFFSLAFTLTSCWNFDNPLEDLEGSGSGGGGSTTTVAKITVAPEANTAGGDIIAGSTTYLVTIVTADGGTMMYLVTTDNAKPTSTEGFSATVPTAEGREPGTYYVWYYAKGDATHADSEISATGVPVTVKAAYTMAKDATEADKGKLICADGHIHADGADTECTKARVAKIIYVGSSTDNTTYTHGLALALTDENDAAWEAAKTACSNKNTLSAVTGASWMLPSKNQWDTMISAAGGTTSLRDGFSGITGASNLQSINYWSSTEKSPGLAYDYYFGTGSWYDLPTGGNAGVRACLAF